MIPKQIIQSEILGERVIRVFLPNGYAETNERYPVLYLHDGQNVFSDEEAFEGNSLQLEPYLSEQDVQWIVVAIDHDLAENARIHEYSPWPNAEASKKINPDGEVLGGKGELYTRFVLEELVPHIDRTYRTTRERLISGSSLGGLISLYITAQAPDVFPRALCISPAFHFNQEPFEEYLERMDLSKIEAVYLDYGTIESLDPDSQQHFASAIHSVDRILREHDVPTELEIFKGAIHDTLEWRKRMPDILERYGMTPAAKR